MQSHDVRFSTASVWLLQVQTIKGRYQLFIHLKWGEFLKERKVNEVSASDELDFEVAFTSGHKMELDLLKSQVWSHVDALK